MWGVWSDFEQRKRKQSFLTNFINQDQISISEFKMIPFPKFYEEIICSKSYHILSSPAYERCLEFFSSTLWSDSCHIDLDRISWRITIIHLNSPRGVREDADEGSGTRVIRCTRLKLSYVIPCLIPCYPMLSPVIPCYPMLFHVIPVLSHVILCYPRVIPVLS